MAFEQPNENVPGDETAKMLRFVQLHLGHGDPEAGQAELERAWVAALKLVECGPATDSDFIAETLRTRDSATLAHLFFHLHFYFAHRSARPTFG